MATKLNMVDCIENTLRNIFQSNGWSKVQMIFGAENPEVEIEPCSYSATITEEKQVEYFLINCTMVNYCGADTLHKVAEMMAEHSENCRRALEEKEELKRFFENHIKSGNYDRETWSYYSDWHKDVYGYRPHGLVCGVYVSPY